MKFHLLHPDLEWSGQLMFETNSADMFDYHNIVMDGLEFIPYDLGNEIHTEFDMSHVEIQDDVKYVPDYDDDFRWDDDSKMVQKGLFHSHHNMDTYFSEVDQPTLIKGAAIKADYMFVSLICNHDYMFKNFETGWKARIAWHTKHVLDESGLHYAFINNKGEVLGRVNMPTVIFCDVEVEAACVTDTEDMDYQTAKRLYPRYLEQHVGTRVDIEPEFMQKFYEVFTEGIMGKFNPATFILYMKDFYKQRQNFQTRFDSAVESALTSHTPFEYWDKVLYTREFTMCAVVLRLITDIKRITTDVKYKKYKLINKAMANSVNNLQIDKPYE